MRRLCVGVLVLTAVAAAGQVVAAVTPHGPPFAFGGVATHGAYTVTIATDGSVRATGDGGLTRIGNPRLSPSQLTSLDQAAGRANFGSLPTLTRCGNSTAAATTWIRIGSKKVTVTGTCRAPYQRLFKAFVATTHFFSSG